MLNTSIQEATNMNWNITAGRPVYVQLIEQLELALVAGEFPPGSRIPPVR